MIEFENQILRIHISYKNAMTLHTMEHSLRILNEAWKSFCFENAIVMKDIDDNSPEVKSVSKGSLVIDIIVPIVCSLLPILYDAIKQKFSSQREYVVTMYSDRGLRWTDEDNYRVCEAVLRKYVLQSDSLAVNDFINRICLSKPYSRKSIRMKIQNTKYLMEKDGLANTLLISQLPNCSIMHKQQFEKARQNLQI